MPSGPRLYADLAHLWPLMSPPEDYADEGACLRKELRKRLGAGRARLLELGTGGGHLLHHLAGDFEATAVDLSEAMLAHSRRLNPGVTHVIGDMRTVRLGETFDTVLIHDAIDYLRTEDDLRAAFATARAHLRPGGLLLAIPDDYVETFNPPRITHETRRRDGAELTYVEYSTDPDPTDTEIETVYVFFFRENGRLRVEVDRHVTGLFPIRTWERLLTESGFAPERLDYPFSEHGAATYLWVGAVPPGTKTARSAGLRPASPSAARRNRAPGTSPDGANVSTSSAGLRPASRPQAAKHAPQPIPMT